MLEKGKPHETHHNIHLTFDKDHHLSSSPYTWIQSPYEKTRTVLESDITDSHHSQSNQVALPPTKTVKGVIREDVQKGNVPYLS